MENVSIKITLTDNGFIKRLLPLVLFRKLAIVDKSLYGEYYTRNGSNRHKELEYETENCEYNIVKHGLGS